MPLAKALKGIPPSRIKVIDRWLATPKRARLAHRLLEMDSRLKAFINIFQSSSIFNALIVFTGFCFGVIVLGMSFFAKYAAVTVVQFSSAMAGTFKGPVLGLFVLGIHFPWTNAIVSGNSR